METKRFFSDDVIQRITSGNEPTQTKISLDVLKKVLKPHQMRNVLGGSGSPYVYCDCPFEGFGYYGYCAYATCSDCLFRECATGPGLYCHATYCWDL